MKKIKMILLTALTILLIACADSESIRGNDRRIPIAGINGIGFENILPNLNEGEIGTPFGWSIMSFDGNDSFVVISVPANEENVVVYFNARVSPQEDISKVWVTTYRNNPPFSFIANREILIPHREGNLSYHRIGIRGKFREYRQENIVFVGNDGGHRAIQMRKATPRELNASALNTVYIMPYPWRNIRISTTINGSSLANIQSAFGYDFGNAILFYGLNRTFDWLNNNVFNQAISRIERNNRDFEHQIILCNNAVGISFFDEMGEPYNPLVSGRVASAEIYFSGLSSASFMRRMAYAIAFMAGASEDGNERNLMSRYNSTNAHDDTTQIYLNFRQWNQLQARR